MIIKFQNHFQLGKKQNKSTYEGMSGGGSPPVGLLGGGGTLPPGRPGTEGAGRLVGAGGGPRLTGGGTAFLILPGEVCGWL